MQFGSGLHLSLCRMPSLLPTLYKDREEPVKVSLRLAALDL
jgi:hypothetical protein